MKLKADLKILKMCAYVRLRVPNDGSINIYTADAGTDIPVLSLLMKSRKRLACSFLIKVRKRLADDIVHFS